MDQPDDHLERSHLFYTPFPLLAHHKLDGTQQVVHDLIEGFGYTPVQSICCSTPVVSTRSGALGELFPPKHGMRYIGYGAVKEAAVAVVEEVPAETNLFCFLGLLLSSHILPL